MPIRMLCLLLLAVGCAKDPGQPTFVADVDASSLDAQDTVDVGLSAADVSPQMDAVPSSDAVPPVDVAPSQDVAPPVDVVAVLDVAEADAPQADAAAPVDVVLKPKSAYVDGMVDGQDPLYQKIIAHLPAGAKPSDYITSLEVTARKAGPDIGSSGAAVRL